MQMIVYTIIFKAFPIKFMEKCIVMAFNSCLSTLHCDSIEGTNDFAGFEVN